MSLGKEIFIFLIALFVFIVVAGFITGSLSNMIFPPSEAVYGEKVVEDIGGDGILIATLDNCVKTSEKGIPDGTFDTNKITNLSWRDAKNISYVDTQGRKGYMIVWKASPDLYSVLDKNGVSYISDYIVKGEEGQCFMEYSPKTNEVYGIILNSDEIVYSESGLMYDILDLDRNDFDLTYQNHTTTSSGYSGGNSHYGGVDNGPYSLAKNDPAWYYDDYDYGDYDEIDEYLESEGYD